MTEQEIAATIAAGAKPNKIILFGSRARDGAAEDSDYDLLVVAELPGTPRDRRRAIRKLFDRPDFSMDLFVLTPMEYELQKSIPNTVSFTASREGKVLYG